MCNSENHLPVAEYLWNHPNLLQVRESAAGCFLVMVTLNALTQMFLLDYPEALPIENTKT
jgi:hypothetical protein